MNNTIKAALIVGAAIVLAIGLYVYFSPYQSCMRENMSDGRDRGVVSLICKNSN